MKQIKKDLTDLEEKIVSGGNLEIKENSLFIRLQQIEKIEDQQKTVSGSGKGSREKKEGLSDRFSETDRNKKKF